MADEDDWGNTLDDQSIVDLRRMKTRVFGLRGNVAGGPGGKAPDTNVVASDPGLQFLNDSGEEAPAGACMLITGFTDSDGETGGTAGKGSPIIKIGKPSTTFGLYVCNGGIAVPDGEYGICYDVGDVEFLYNTGTPAKEEGFGPTVSQWYWTKGNTAAITCYGKLDSTLKIAYGTLVPIRACLGKATGAIAATSSGTNYRFYGGTAGSESDIGWTTVPTAYNKGATAIANNDWVWLEFTNNAWYIGKIC